MAKIRSNISYSKSGRTAEWIECLLPCIVCVCVYVWMLCTFHELCMDNWVIIDAQHWLNLLFLSVSFPWNHLYLSAKGQSQTFFTWHSYVIHSRDLRRVSILTRIFTQSGIDIKSIWCLWRIRNFFIFFRGFWTWAAHDSKTAIDYA